MLRELEVSCQTIADSYQLVSTPWGAGHLVSLTHSLVLHWIGEDIAMAAERLDALHRDFPDESIMARLYERVGKNWVQADEEAAYAWLSGLDSDAARKGAVEGMVRGIADRNPARAAEWLTHFPDKSTRDTAAYTIGLNWGYKNADEAEQWIMTLTDDDIRHAAAKGVVFPQMTSDPIEAMARIDRMARTSQERLKLLNATLGFARFN